MGTGATTSEAPSYGTILARTRQAVRVSHGC